MKPHSDLLWNGQYIAQKILEINENGKYKKSFATVEEYMAQDDEIFHRSRLVNCGFFMNIILKGKLHTILLRSSMLIKTRLCWCHPRICTRR